MVIKDATLQTAGRIRQGGRGDRHKMLMAGYDDWINKSENIFNDVSSGL